MARVESRAEPYQAGMNVALQTAKYSWIYQKVIQFYCTTYIHICIYACDVVYKVSRYILMYIYIYIRIGSMSNPMSSSKTSENCWDSPTSRASAQTQGLNRMDAGHGRSEK